MIPFDLLAFSIDIAGIILCSLAAFFPSNSNVVHGWSSRSGLLDVRRVGRPRRYGSGSFSPSVFCRPPARNRSSAGSHDNSSNPLPTMPLHLRHDCCRLIAEIWHYSYPPFGHVHHGGVSWSYYTHTLPSACRWYGECVGG